MRIIGIRLAIFITVLGGLAGCKGDASLLDLYPLEPIVNPEAGILISENHIVHARLDGRRTISGITANGLFRTANNFQSINFVQHLWQGEQGVVRFKGDVIIHAFDADWSFSLRYSTDYGQSWNTFPQNIVDNLLLSAGAVQIADVYIHSDGTLWILASHRLTSQNRLLLYYVDLSGHTSELVFERDEAVPLHVGFADDRVGWLVFVEQQGGADAGNVRVSKTADRGVSWSAAATLDGISDTRLLVVDAQTILIHNPAGDYYHSGNGGESFERITGNGMFDGLVKASADVLYAFSGQGVSKSVDKGRSWLDLQAESHGVTVAGQSADFYNERQGIVYGPDRIFLTENGGESWHILVYPYEYVME